MIGRLKQLAHPVLNRFLRTSYVRRKVSERPEKYVEILVVDVGGRQIRFFAFGAVCRWRAETLLSKEPETIEWINRFEPGDVLWDIGANVGVYTMYAAALKGCKVRSFEPASTNYYILNKNISLNGFAPGQVVAFPIAFSNHSHVASFHMHSLEGGHALFEMRDDAARSGSGFEQGVLALSLDDTIALETLDRPTHVKIDVDGEEDNIIESADKFMENSRLRSLLIELDEKSPRYRASIDLLEARGFRITHKGEAAIDGASSFRNHIFARD